MNSNFDSKGFDNYKGNNKELRNRSENLDENKLDQSDIVNNLNENDQFKKINHKENQENLIKQINEEIKNLNINATNKKPSAVFEYKER